MAVLINDTSALVVYTATAGQTTFAVPFEFFDAENIVVEVDGTALTYSASPADATQYSVSGANVEGGGAIAIGGAGLALGARVLIYRNIPIDRRANYPETGPFSVRALNEEQARQIAIMQQLDAECDRGLKGPRGEIFGELPALADRASKFLAFDSNGDPIASEGTDANSQLAAELATNGGALLIGKAGGGTVQDFITEAEGRGLIYMEDYGADGTQAGDSAALKAAIAAATATWSPVILPARRIFWDGTTITEDKVRLWGAGMPALNAAKTALEGGTIIQGGLLLTGDFIDLRDFGVDIGSASGVTATDAIKCLASPLDSGKALHTENIIGLCDSPASAVHALLFEGYAQHTGGNIHGVNGFFSVVIKNRNVRLTSVKGTDSSDTGLYLKSDDTFGRCSNVQIDSVEVTGATAGAVDYAVRFQADSALMDNIQVGQIRASGHGTTLLVQTLDFAGAAFGSAQVGSIISEGATTDDVFIYNLRSGGELNHVEIGSIISINPLAKVLNLLNEAGAEIDNVKIGSIYASYASGTTSGVLDGAGFIGSGVLRTDIRSATILVEHSDASLGALNYASAGNDHVLGARVCRVTGPGRPQPGFSIQALSGTTATLVVPKNEAGTRTSLVKLTHASPITITTFALPVASDAGFEVGHVLTLFNATSNLVTVNNNGAGGILNPGYANVTIGENEVKAWVLGDDSVWRGLP